MTLDLSLKTETRLLIDALRTAPIGQVVSFATLSAACGLDVQAQGRGLLSSARRIVARDHGAVFVSERTVGLRRLRPEEAPRAWSIRATAHPHLLRRGAQEDGRAGRGIQWSAA
jgi:hypothetical protein